MDGDAKKLGERLLGEVESEGLSELFASLRGLSLPHTNHHPRSTIFGIPKLDALLHPQQPRQPHHQPNNKINSNAQTTSNNPLSPSQPQPLTIDLLSPPHSLHPSGAGKSTLTSLLITHAILPQSLLGVPLNGASSSIILIDPLSHFRASRLAEFLLNYLTTTLSAHGGHDVRSASVKEEVLGCVRRALGCVLIYRPSSWTSFLSTLEGLPGYLFNDDDDDDDDDEDVENSTHLPHRNQTPLSNPITNRPIHAIILEDLHTFVPNLRSTSSSRSPSSPLALLTPRLRTLHNTLRPAAIVLTSLSHLATPSTTTTTTAAGPGTLVPSGITRLAVRRIEVAKFKPGISVEEAEAERELRWRVVERGRFEVWRVGVGVGDAVVFRVRGKGDVVVEGGGGDSDSDGGGGSEVVMG